VNQDRRLNILLLTRPNFSLTGSGTYEANLLRELGRMCNVKLYESEHDLEQPWDIAHCTNLKHLSWSLARRLNCPLVVDVHDYYWVQYYHFLCPDFPLRFLLQKLRRLKYHFLFKQIDGLILHGQFLYDLIQHPRKYFSFYFGLDYSAIAPRPWQERDDLILFVGGDYFRKGLPRLLKALPLVLTQVPTAKVLVIGKEPWHSRLAAKFMSRGLPVEYIHGMPREEVYRTYSRGKVLVLPSEIEATPLVIAEGTMAGLPPVVSRVGGHPELVRHGETGFLFDLDDTATLADHLVQCLTRPELSQRLVDNGRAFLAQFTVGGMIDRLEAIYRDLMAQPGRKEQAR